MSDSKKTTGGDRSGTGPGGDPLLGLGAAWRAPLEAMNAWSDAWRGIMEKRGVPAFEMMMGAFANPAAWPESVEPVMDEIQRAFALPRFADLPRLDASLLPSAGTTVDLMMLFQQYLTAMVPVWLKACDRFQAEVRERREKGETLDVVSDGMDIWNNVLDRTLMEFNRSSDFGGLQQKMLHMAMRQRQDLRRRVELASAVVDMPTRTEMLDVYRRLHGLMREVQTLRREVSRLKAAKPERPATQEAAKAEPASSSEPPASPAAAKPAPAPRRVSAKSRKQS